MKAIETKYKGFKFRSRQEARWAVFFDSVGVPWEFEKEGFELSSGYYLPDFWLPTLDCFFEVKGEIPNELEIKKAMDLSEGSKKLVAIASGQTKTEPLKYGSVHVEWPVEEFNIQIFAGHSSSVWPCKVHDFWMWNWLMDTDLPPFIKDQFPGISFPSDDEERRRIIVECDKKYYKNKYGKEHPRYIHGRHEKRVYIVSDPANVLRFALEPENEPSKISSAFEKARGARLEFGNSGA